MSGELEGGSGIEKDGEAFCEIGLLGARVELPLGAGQGWPGASMGGCARSEC